MIHGQATIEPHSVLANYNKIQSEPYTSTGFGCTRINKGKRLNYIMIFGLTGSTSQQFDNVKVQELLHYLNKSGDNRNY